MKLIHLHPNRLDNDFNVFLLFIPIIIFALMLAYTLSVSSHLKISKSSETTSVLGQDTLNP